MVDYDLQVINSMTHSKLTELLNSNNGKLKEFANQIIMTDGLNDDEQKTLEDDIEQIKKELDSKLNFNDIYPIGSIFLTLNDYTSPAQIFGGTWERISAGYALWTASSGAGETLSAGLPNITGNICVGGDTFSNTNSNSRVGGAFRPTAKEVSGQESGGGGGKDNGVTFDASRSSGIYGSSSTVQPPAYKVYAYKRVS